MMNWSDEQTISFIEMYPDRSLLWAQLIHNTKIKIKGMMDLWKLRFLLALINRHSRYTCLYSCVSRLVHTYGGQAENRPCRSTPFSIVWTWLKSTKNVHRHLRKTLIKYKFVIVTYLHYINNIITKTSINIKI